MKQRQSLVSRMQLAHGWGYHYLKSGRERIVYGGWHALDENEYTHLNIAVSETRFLGILVQY